MYRKHRITNWSELLVLIQSARDLGKTLVLTAHKEKSGSVDEPLDFAIVSTESERRFKDVLIDACDY